MAFMAIFLLSMSASFVAVFVAQLQKREPDVELKTRTVIFAAIGVFTVGITGTSLELGPWLIRAFGLICLGIAIPVGWYAFKPKVEEVAAVPQVTEVPPEVAALPSLKDIPTASRLEHMLILGGSGAGKSQLISQLISYDLFKPCSVVVFDSQGDLLNNILKVDVPRDRVVYIDPTDVDFPISLSLFDYENRGQTNFEKEKNFNSVVELLLYVLSSLDSTVTAKQELCLRMLIRLCLVIPDATIHTLRELLSETTFERHRVHIGKLTYTAQSFFETEYFAKGFNETREQISRRVYTILESPLERIFSATKSRINMGELLDNGSIILINTAKSFLKEQGSVFFTRFMTALVFQAIQERNPQKDNLEVFMYIDEAAPVISEQTTNILETARKYKLGLTLAFQSLGQVPSEHQHSIITNTAIKAVGGISAKDARALADDMHTRPENLMSTPKLSFYTFVKGLWTQVLPVELGSLQKLPQRKDLRELIKNNRERYARPAAQVQRVVIKPADPLQDIEDLNRS